VTRRKKKRGGTQKDRRKTPHLRRCRQKEETAVPPPPWEGKKPIHAVKRGPHKISKRGSFWFLEKRRKISLIRSQKGGNVHMSLVEGKEKEIGALTSQGERTGKKGVVSPNLFQDRGEKGEIPLFG